MKRVQTTECVEASADYRVLTLLFSSSSGDTAEDRDKEMIAHLQANGKGYNKLVKQYIKQEKEVKKETKKETKAAPVLISGYRYNGELGLAKNKKKNPTSELNTPLLDQDFLGAPTEKPAKLGVVSHMMEGKAVKFLFRKKKNYDRDPGAEGDHLQAPDHVVMDDRFVADCDVTDYRQTVTSQK